MSALGKDLASIRKSKQISLEEVHATTKIPLSTLKSIEDGSLFIDSSQQHLTYVRSFVRSFGKALKISDDALVDALNSFEKGQYTDELLAHGGLGSSSAPLFELESTEPQKETPEPPPIATHDPSTDSETSSTDTKKEYEVSPAPPTVDTVNWADMGKKFGVDEVKSRTWILVVSIVLIISVAAVLFFFGGDILDRFTSDSTSASNSTSQVATPTITSPTEESTGNPSSEPAEVGDNLAVTDPGTATQLPATPNLQQLGDTLSLTVYAAFDILEPVRVTSDYTWRTNPYWIEQSQAYSFAFRDTILVRGQYTRMLLMLNGHVIENARQLYFADEFDSIMLTRSIFENDSTFIQPPPVDFPYAVGPPTQVINR